LICRICGYPVRIINDAFAVQEIPKGVNMLQVGHALVSDWHRIIFARLFRIACCSVLIPKRSMPKRRHVRQFALQANFGGSAATCSGTSSVHSWTSGLFSASGWAEDLKGEAIPQAQ
jgi:hypothetical protein